MTTLDNGLRPCERYSWCVGHAAGADITTDGCFGTVPVYVNANVGHVDLAVEVKQGRVEFTPLQVFESWTWDGALLDGEIADSEAVVSAVAAAAREVAADIRKQADR
ncbi:hypothetical protein [Microbacterium sp. KR10-403]|uniref:hypothetical protein n=1 Tax=Microbacterium sp. KR10-403 TaxID=3158581 RepID=UPI0032E42AEA